ncbi:MAG: cytochrome b/b6 domain-containing protein [Candidatus Solibacter usitatus]|nr:cytochrome b/b6 domain-containing protein [Candidatus Solibacter usitatus]
MSARHALYPLWLRIWHWSNALLFLTLIVTGTSMHFAHPGQPQVDFRTARLIHNSCGILLTAFYLVFLCGNLGRNGRHYSRGWNELPRGLVRQLRYYFHGIFLGAPHPHHPSPEQKFNPMQKVAYLVMMYAALPVLTVTGWALFFPDKTPEHMLGTTGIGALATAHSALGYLFSLFMVVHIYLGTTGDTSTALFKNMLLGDVTPLPDPEESSASPLPSPAANDTHCNPAQS